MKVTLNNSEIQEAVQCYIANILGSDLKVTEISVVQGREQGGSNTSRIELELTKSENLKQCTGTTMPVNACAEIAPMNEVNEVKSETVENNIEKVQEDVVPMEEPKAETSKPLSEPVVEQTVNASFFNRAN